MVFPHEWEFLWKRAGLFGTPNDRESSYKDLLDSYCQPHRRYHGLEHIATGLRLWEQFRNSGEAFPYLTDDVDIDFQLAWLFHDLVYNVDPQNYPVNEEASAQRAVHFLRAHGAEEGRQDQVRSIILATKHQGYPSSFVSRAAVDIDLAGLGFPWPVFQRNNRHIREEFANTLDEVFWPMHLEVLEGFLGRSPLYYTPYFQQRFDLQARLNLERRIREVKREYALS